MTEIYFGLQQGRFRSWFWMCHYDVLPVYSSSNYVDYGELFIAWVVLLSFFSSLLAL
jgi:hypothetical protein